MASRALSRLRDMPWLLALLAASIWQIVRSMGVSPTVWIDTLFENVFIQDCLQDHQCSLVGAGATAGIFHSAGYLHWRIFMEWVGIGPDGTHGALLVLTGVGVVLAALTALRLDGRLAASVAALLVIWSIGIPTQLNVISDVAPLPFLGCAFLLVALSTHSRPSLAMTALLAVFGGVLANVYATGLLCAVTSVWLALLAPDRRRAHFITAVVAFSLSTFLIAPGTWITDVRLILQHGVVGNAQGSGHRALFSIPLVRLTAASVLVWILAALVRPAFRRRIDVAAAMVIPLFIPLALGSWSGKLDPQDKYCSHVIGAVAVLLGVTCASLLRAAFRPVTTRVPQVAALDMLVPVAAAALIAQSASAQRAPENAGTLSYFTFRDVADAQRLLTQRHGWSASTARQNLRVVDDAVKRSLIEWPQEWSTAEGPHALGRAYLLRVPRELLPAAVPAFVEKVSQDEAASTVLAFSCSWIDWGHFEACSRQEGSDQEQCLQSGLPEEQDIHSDYGTPGMPGSNDVREHPQRLTLRIPLHAAPNCPVFSVQMPQMAGVCPGRIVGATGARVELKDEARSALLRVSSEPQQGPSELVVEWNLGDPNCAREYRGAPPFFIEGNPESVAFVASTLPVWR